MNRLLIVPHFSNLVYDVDERQLGEVFGMFGQVRDVKIPKKGHAIIEYRESSEALRALIILRNQLLEGRKLMIKMDGAPFAKSTDNSRGNFERGPPPPSQQYRGPPPPREDYGAPPRGSKVCVEGLPLTVTTSIVR